MNIILSHSICRTLLDILVDGVTLPNLIVQDKTSPGQDFILSHAPHLYDMVGFQVIQIAHVSTQSRNYFPTILTFCFLLFCILSTEAKECPNDMAFFFYTSAS